MTIMEYKEESNTDTNHPIRKTKKGWDIIKSSKVQIAEKSSDTNIEKSKKIQKNLDNNEDIVPVVKKSSDTNRKKSKKTTKNSDKNTGQPEEQVRKS